VVTDAGSVQEQTSALGVRCYTLLSTTPRPITLTHGTNALLGDDPAALSSVRPTRWAPTPTVIPGWDGRAGDRVAAALAVNYTLAAASAGDR
jgi:UDP-N-acetylglucosamine 2-epimerase (non-hydrolysing)